MEVGFQCPDRGIGQVMGVFQGITAFIEIPLQLQGTQILPFVTKAELGQVEIRIQLPETLVQVVFKDGHRNGNLFYEGNGKQGPAFPACTSPYKGFAARTEFEVYVFGLPLFLEKDLHAAIRIDRFVMVRTHSPQLLFHDREMYLQILAVMVEPQGNLHSLSFIPTRA